MIFRKFILFVVLLDASMQGWQRLGSFMELIIILLVQIFNRMILRDCEVGLAPHMIETILVCPVDRALSNMVA